MKKLKSMNDNVANPLKKVASKSKAITSSGERKKEALKTALIAKSKQLKKASKKHPKLEDKKKEQEQDNSAVDKGDPKKDDNLEKVDEITLEANKQFNLLDKQKSKKKTKNPKEWDQSGENAGINKKGSGTDGVPKVENAKVSSETTEVKSSKKVKKTKEGSKEAVEDNSRREQRELDKVENTSKDVGKVKKKTKRKNPETTSEESSKKPKKAKEIEKSSSDVLQEQDSMKVTNAVKHKKTKNGKEQSVTVSDNGITDEKEKKPSDPECTVFVGNLPQNVKKQQLISLFKNYGNVISVRLRNALGNTLFKHKSRKETECLNAYVVLDTPENALSALKLSGTEFRGRHIRVTKSSRNKLSDESNKRTVFVGNLKHKVTEETLYEIFNGIGEIEATRTVKNSKGCIGIGYVTFKSKEALNLAQELNGTLVLGRPMRVEKYSQVKINKLNSEGKKTSEDKPNVKKVKKMGEGPKKKGSFKGKKISIKDGRKKKWSKKLGGNPVQTKLAKKIAPRNA